jgi:glycosyltransferase involved in cell wall biosynthesis
MTRLRVLHCLETVGSGGVEQTRLSLARGLDPSRYEQRIVCTQAIGGLPQLLRDAGCALHPIGTFDGILDRERYRRALRVVREFRPHVIHGAVYEGVALAAVAGRLGRVPVILGEETSDPANRSWRGHALLRALAALTHRMVAVSPAVQDYLVRKIHIPARKVALINNGVAERLPPTPDAIGALRQRLGLLDSDFVVGTVGRLLDGVKRVSDLIRALALIRKECRRARLLVVGDGPDLDALRSLASELGLSRDVMFAGYQADPSPFYSVMDVFALASSREAFGLVLVEAMFARLPVVATRVGGVPFVVEDGQTGILVDPMDPEALAKAILGLSRSSTRATMGERGRARAVTHFGVNRYVEEVGRLYEDLAAAHTLR